MIFILHMLYDLTLSSLFLRTSQEIALLTDIQELVFQESWLISKILVQNENWAPTEKRKLIRISHASFQFRHRL